VSWLAGGGEYSDVDLCSSNPKYLLSVVFGPPPRGFGK
jgi:hypothetical protein